MEDFRKQSFENTYSFFLRFQKQKKILLSQQKVGEVLFSEGTYEIEIFDTKASKVFWPFLQVDDKGAIEEAFCTCLTSEEKGFCEHLAKAFFQIFKEKNPLHVRFRKSLWNLFFRFLAKKWNQDPQEILKEKEGRFSLLSPEGELLFFLEAKTKKEKERLHALILERIKETEETSLKFSHLSEEELSLWKRGKASEEFLYELSFWSDIAKYLFLLQVESKNYSFEIKEREDLCPYWIDSVFEEVAVGFFVEKETFEELIPSFSTIPSVYEVHEYEKEAIDAIVYEEEKRGFLVSTKETFEEWEKKIPPLFYLFDHWYYVPKKGFYSRFPHLIKEGLFLTKERVSSLLSEYTELFQTFLKNTKIFSTPCEEKYHLFFDEKDQLHLCGYIEEKGDLQKEKSFYFGPWVYLEDRGFFLVKDPLFPGKEKILVSQEISDFVTRYQDFLRTQEGFVPYMGDKKTKIGYTFTPEGNLYFFSEKDREKEEKGEKDFGDWLFVPGKGFYFKRPTVSLFGGASFTVKREEIGRFLASHKEILEQIEEFFLSRNPIDKIGLKVFVRKDLSIEIQSEICLLPEYQSSLLHLFDNFLYVEGRGFFEIPYKERFPLQWSGGRIVAKEKENTFIDYELERLKPWILFLDPRLSKPQELFLVLQELSFETESAKDFFARLLYRSEIGEVKAAELWKALREGRKYFFSPAGLLLLSENRFQWMKNFLPSLVQRRRGLFHMNALEWIRLNTFEIVLEPQGASPFLEKLKKMEPMEDFTIEALQATLRPYQYLGVKWLWFLYSYGLSGLLCDEMGLGKTHQMMALIAAIHEKYRERKFLVVCPTSVLYHWQDLLKTFLPHLRVRVFHGLGRSLENFSESADLLLTSYGIVRLDKELLESLSFELAIFDEFHFAKNQASQIHKTLRKIKSEMRLGLTGTPIENRLTELQALFDLVLPSFLPKNKAFRDFFLLPIEKEGNEERKALLTRMIKPFILRRKKQEVLADLPEKIEAISFCELSEEQRELYEKELLASRGEIVETLKEEKASIPYLHIFSLLSRLKQICDHPALFLKEQARYTHHFSGKWELFLELLEEARESGQKVVVFSQYLDMLSIIEQFLQKHQIGFASLTGSTIDRRAPVERFREDPNCEVFVASLLAAGVGIDLSAASVVIHYDRWWNPAKEDQATDRVHRIGQKRGVQVFKLLTKNTIEEHIQDLVEKKRGLLEATIGKEEGDPIRYLSREELLFLLSQSLKG